MAGVARARKIGIEFGFHGKERNQPATSWRRSFFAQCLTSGLRSVSLARQRLAMAKRREPKCALQRDAAQTVVRQQQECLLMARSANNQLSPLGAFALVVGIICFVAAGVFASAQTVRVTLPREQAYTDAPNTTAAGAACGFAIAGGLCFVAAAIFQGGRLSRMPSDHDAEPGAAPDPARR
jgi:hypothetical protein